MRRVEMSSLLASLLLASIHAAAAAAAASPPHMVFVLADDLGWNDLTGFGAGNRMQTRKSIQPGHTSFGF